MKRNGKKDTKRTKQGVDPLPVLAGVVALAAASVLLLPKLSGGDRSGAPDALPAGSDLVIQTEEIGAEASYFDYNADGTTVQVFAARASDGTVRLALNTCQVCNGSPYAYFEQEGDDFVCQNCGNRITADQIGGESGGCIPYPISASNKTVTDDSILIPYDFLESSRIIFSNWKSSW